MKFLHLADLHFGKSMCSVSLLESGDQPVWVRRFLKMAQDIRPDAVVIAGDIYDRSAPSGDAVLLLDRLITGLAALDISVLAVAGNHDSGQRISFGRSLLAKQNVHIAGMPTKELAHVTMTDRNGPVTFWLMPYVFPALVAEKLEDSSIRDYNTAVRRLLAEQHVDFSQRNVLVAHQNVTANGKESERGGSESMVGGVGQVDYSVFDGFDYVALGHIHAAYSVGRETVRYAGSPLCYHFNELRQPVKGPVLVELGAKGTPPVIKTLKIEPLHPLRELRGSYSELQAEALQSNIQGEYVRVVLTDRRPKPEIYEFFRSLFRNQDSRLLDLTSEYRQFGAVNAVRTVKTEGRTVEELFAEFYSERQEEEPDELEQDLIRFAGEQVRNMGRGDEAQEMERQIMALRKYALRQEGVE